MAAIVGTGALAAQSSPPPVDPALRARFGFRGPLIHKLTDGIDLLTVAPLAANSGGGKAAAGAAIVVNDGRRGRLDVLTVEPEAAVAGAVTGTASTPADDAAFVVRETAERTTTEIVGLGIGDVDGDGTAELLTMQANGRLRVQRRGDGATAIPDVQVGLPASRDCLRTGDVDGDGKTDAVVLTREGVVVVTRIAAAARVGAADPLQDSRPRGFELLDLNGDGHLDVAVATSAERMPLQVKLGSGDGEFGAWLLFDVPAVTAAFVGAGGDARGGRGARDRATLALIEGGDRRVVEYVLRASTSAAARPAVQLTSLPAVSARIAALPHAHGDVDGDGDLDLILADPERARLVWLLEEQGRFEMRTTPTLAGVQSIAIGDADGDGKPDVVVASPEEEVLAWTRGGGDPLAFPERIAVTGKPVAVAIAPPSTPAPEGSDAKGHGIVCLTRDAKREAKLVRLVPAPAGFAAASTAELERLVNDPIRLAVADVGGDPGPEVLFVVPGEGLKVLTTRGGKLVALGDAEAGGFTRKIEDGAFAVVAHDGQPAVLVTRERFARVFRVAASGEPQILVQEHGPEGASIALSARAPNGERLLVDRAANKLHRLVEGAAPVSVDVPPIGATHVYEHHGAALIVGTKGVLRVPFGPAFELHALRSHEPPIEKTNWYRGVAADLDGDGGDELVLLDEHVHGVHVLVAEGQQLRRAVSFPVFEMPQARSDVYEPRDVATGDVDGDGRVDLVLIAHDRVLIYLQER